MMVVADVSEVPRHAHGQDKYIPGQWSKVWILVMSFAMVSHRSVTPSSFAFVPTDKNASDGNSDRNDGTDACLKPSLT